jgi:hypothetical protein
LILKMEALCSLKTSIKTYRITQSQIPEDNNL